MDETHRLMQDRIKKLEELKAQGIDPYPYRFEKNSDSKQLQEKFSHLEKEEKTTHHVKIAGRIMTMRRMGKVTFMHIQDGYGKIQLYLQEDTAKNYELLKKFDMGDFIGVEGIIFKTRTGEITVEVHTFTLLTKSLRPLPEKWHGLQELELRYRQRYLDLITNEKSKEVFITRSKIVSAMREFLDKKGFLEVETPTLQPIYGGAAAKPFTTMHNELKMKMYLKISDELYLKRLIIGGFEKVYEIDKDFRNESIDTTHNPEFTMMECYWAYADYNDVMELVEDLYVFIAEKVLGTTKVTYQEKTIDFKKPWKRMTMNDALREFAKINVDDLSDDDLLKEIKKHKIELKHGDSRGYLIEALFGELCEEHLIQPIFIIDHPKETTPLCKLHRKNPELIERFEPFCAGFEIGNAYSELNDPILQKQFLTEQAKLLKKGDEEANPLDDDFVEAMEYGMPPTGGLGIGIDRMVMLFTDAASIRDVILFPTMKPKS
ncbi:lysine--tRNA ligase [Candidatus Woesearchaeota archaeon]|nr:MAG: lysine--tRNA ligase [Candidatus Woesearchaeota archaeon]